MPTNPTISDDYRRIQQELHQNPSYGVASAHIAPVVKELITSIGATSVSDYGAGKKRLHMALRSMGVDVDYYPYDPAFPEYGNPLPADLVCCIDVLEHVEHEYIDDVILQLATITFNQGFFTVNTAAAKKTLPDGRNAHITQRPSSWWLKKFERYFHILTSGSVKDGFWIITKPINQDFTTLMFQQAAIYHKTGYLQDAKQFYLAIIQVQPNHADASHGLGILAMQANQTATGLAHFKRALDADPTQNRYWFSYIDALIQANQTDAAKQALLLGQRGGLQGVEIELLTEKLGKAIKQQSPEIITWQHAELSDIPCTVIIATYNRSKLVIALVKALLLDSNEKISIVVIDDSVGEDALNNKFFFDSFHHQKITYLPPIHGQKRGLFPALTEASAFAKTPYTIYCGDDDYVNCKTIRLACAELDKFTELGAVTGHMVGVTLDGTGASYCMDSFSYLGETPQVRLYQLTKNYSHAFHAVCRKPIFEAAFKASGQPSGSASWLAQLLPSIVVVKSGKVSILNEALVFRGGHKNKAGNNTDTELPNIIFRDDFLSAANAFFEQVAQVTRDANYGKALLIAMIGRHFGVRQRPPLFEEVMSGKITIQVPQHMIDAKMLVPDSSPFNHPDAL